MSEEDTSPLPKFRKPPPVLLDVEASPPVNPIIKRQVTVTHFTTPPNQSRRASFMKCKLFDHQAAEEGRDGRTNSSISENSGDDDSQLDESYVTDGSYSNGSPSVYLAGMNSQAEGFSTPMHRTRHRDRTPLHEIIEARIIAKKKSKQIAKAAAAVTATAATVAVSTVVADMPSKKSPAKAADVSAAATAEVSAAPAAAVAAVAAVADVAVAAVDNASFLHRKKSVVRPLIQSTTLPMMWQRLVEPPKCTLQSSKNHDVANLSFVPGRIIPETPISTAPFQSRTKLLLRPKAQFCHVATQTDLPLPQVQHRHIEIQTSVTLNDNVMRDLQALLIGLGLL
jgi:hypothetical protein